MKAKPKTGDERFTVEWTPAILVEAAARERGYDEEDEYARSFWDFVNTDEFLQSKSFKSKNDAFKAAKSRCRIDVCGEVRMQYEVYDEALDYWEERNVWHIYRNTKSLKEAA